MDMFQILHRPRPLTQTPAAPAKALARALAQSVIAPRATAVALALIAGLWTGLANPGFAHAGDDKAVIIELSNPRRSLHPMAIPKAVSGDTGLVAQVDKTASFDMKVSGLFRLVEPRLYRLVKDQGLAIDANAWKKVGAFGVMKYKVVKRGDKVALDTRLYEVGKGDQAVLSRTYQGADIRTLTHMWCNDVVEYYTGEKGFFGSKIAFVSKKGKKKVVMAMDFDGAGAYSLTRNRSHNILPAWSPSGGKVAFTSYMRQNPDLYVVGAGGGRPKRVSKHRGMNTGASWSPDGSKLAVTLSKDGNPEIYVISASTGKIIRRLTKNNSIDTSPAWSPSGSEIAFVSDRQGGPQIFVMSASGGNQRRVSNKGSYNTTPVWSPRKGTRLLAYTTRDKGNFDIVTLDLDSKKMVRITQGQGDNEEPSFAPNGHAIAFASKRKKGPGIYIANVSGRGEQVRVYKGYVTSVDWGPAP